MCQEYGERGSVFVESLCGKLLADRCWSLQNLSAGRIFLPTSVLKTVLEHWLGVITSTEHWADQHFQPIQ